MPRRFSDRSGIALFLLDIPKNPIPTIGLLTKKFQRLNIDRLKSTLCKGRKSA